MHVPSIPSQSSCGTIVLVLFVLVFVLVLDTNFLVLVFETDMALGFLVVVKKKEEANPAYPRRVSVI